MQKVHFQLTCAAQKRRCLSSLLAQLSGRSRGGARPPLFLAQNEVRRAEKKFLRQPPPPPLSLSQGLDDRLLMLLGYPTRVPVRVPVNKLYISCNSYTLFDGLAYNTCGYFASCVVFFRAPQGRGKIRAMSKMSARIIC